MKRLTLQLIYEVDVYAGFQKAQESAHLIILIDRFGRRNMIPIDLC